MTVSDCSWRARLVRVLPVMFVTAVVAAFAVHQLAAPTRWNDPDSLFYQAQVLEAHGVSQSAALRSVFDGPLSNPRRAEEQAYHLKNPGAPYHVANPHWVAYSAQFYRRRWLAPALAAAISPIAGNQALRVISIFGYLLLAPILFLLLRRRFSAASSVVAAVVCCVPSMLRDLVVEPMTDTLGLALEAAALLVAVIVYERGTLWLPLWILVMAALAFTRDSSAIPILGVAWLAWRGRSRTAAKMAATGIAAALPPFLVFGGSLRRTLAYTFNGFNRPVHSGWGYVVAHYPHALANMVTWQVRYLVHHPATAVLIAIGAVGLYVGRSRSAYLSLVRAAGIGAVATAYSVPQVDVQLRLEIVVLPMVAVGLAVVFEQFSVSRHRWMPRQAIQAK